MNGLLIGVIVGFGGGSLYLAWLHGVTVKSRDQAVLEAVMDVASRPVELLPVPEGME